jgi:hypothetical protein
MDAQTETYNIHPVIVAAHAEIDRQAQLTTGFALLAMAVASRLSIGTIFERQADLGVITIDPSPSVITLSASKR